MHISRCDDINIYMLVKLYYFQIFSKNMHKCYLYISIFIYIKLIEILHRTLYISNKCTQDYKISIGMRVHLTQLNISDKQHFIVNG